MKTRELRFVGSGNTWVADGHYRGWKVVCVRCGAVKVITGHNGNSLPPHIILKKLTQAGWYIGRKADDDVCGTCRCKRKPKAAQPTPWRAANNNDLFVQLRACLWMAKYALNNSDGSAAKDL